MLAVLTGSRRTAARVMRETGGVAAWACKTGDKPSANRVDDAHEHNRDGAAHLLQRRHILAARRHNEVRRKRDEFLRVSAHNVAVAGATKRWSNWMLRPSVQPSCCSACRNTA
jgi:hypothetical protein